MKKNDYKHTFQILKVIGDFADNSNFTRNRELLHSLYVRGGHSFISTFTATQVYKAISPVIRKNITHLFVFRLRNQTELNALVEEFSALHYHNVPVKMHKEAPDEQHSFLYINLTTHGKSHRSYHSFTSVLRASLPDYEDAYLPPHMHTNL